MTRTGDFIVATPRWGDGSLSVAGSRRAKVPTLSGYRLTATGFRLLAQLGEKRLHALESVREFRALARIRNADRARLAECRTGDTGNALGVQQRIAEIDIVGDR